MDAGGELRAMQEATRDHVVEALPEVEWIVDDDIRRGTIDAWAASMEDTGVDDLLSIPWRSTEQRRLGIPLAAERLVDHVRNVTKGCAALTDLLIEQRGVELERDVTIAGGLLHDVSKLYEFSDDGKTPIGDLLGHPYFGVFIVERAGLPVDFHHIVLSHTKSPIEPATPEAVIVRAADMADAAVIRSGAVDDLRSID